MRITSIRLIQAGRSTYKFVVNTGNLTPIRTWIEELKGSASKEGYLPTPTFKKLRTVPWVRMASCKKLLIFNTILCNMSEISLLTFSYFIAIVNVRVQSSRHGNIVNFRAQVKVENSVVHSRTKAVYFGLPSESVDSVFTRNKD